LKPGFEDAFEEIESEINCKLEKVNWLPGFYSIPPDVHIARTKAYQQGMVRESNQIPTLLSLIRFFLTSLVLSSGFRCTESMQLPVPLSQLLVSPQETMSWIFVLLLVFFYIDQLIWFP
jgi:hypothetical protein